MAFESFIILRNELLLTLVAVIILIAELIFKPGEKNKVIPIAIILFFMTAIAGLIPVRSGVLFGGMFQTTPLILLMKNILNIGVLIIMLQSANWLKNDPHNNNRVSEFFLLIISTLIGMNFMISSGDFLMFYLGLELATIPMAALAAYELYKARSAEGGIKLILLAAFSSAILLFGISIIYGMTGTIYFSGPAKLLDTNSLYLLGFIFFFAGLAFKISIVPFHLWTADVYEGAPVNVTSYLSVISKGAAVFIFTILLFTVFRHITVHWQGVIYITAVLTMIIGNLFAIRQKNLKRFLAFSSIAQSGFIFLGIISATTFGMATVVYFILIYVFSNLGAFGVVSVISQVTGKEQMDDYNGLYRTNPKLSLVLMLSLFSLAGIPPVAGFFGKFFLFTAAAQQGYYLLVLIAVLNAVISLYYYLLVVKAMFINKSDTPIARFKSDLSTRFGLLICVAGIVVIGFIGFIFDHILSLCMNML